MKSPAAYVLEHYQESERFKLAAHRSRFPSNTPALDALNGLLDEAPPREETGPGLVLTMGPSACCGVQVERRWTGTEWSEPKCSCCGVAV